MRGTVIHGPRDVRLEERPDPTILAPTDAVVRTVATCVCGSDLWRYRGIQPVAKPTPIGHEYVGVVEDVGADVTSVRPASSWSAGSSPATTPAPSAVLGHMPTARTELATTGASPS
jgi:D-arabinose 1-dehydrogenase-like Zn-dependent alcohol dehydrogenase